MAKSKRDLLRRLSKQFPDPDEAAKLLEDLPYEKDRSMALIYAAFLDALLQRLITAKFPRLTPNLEGRLFTERGPLSDFDSKILLVDALDILPNADETAPLLHSIKHIRNVFSHSPIDISFDTKEIADEVVTHLLPFAVNHKKQMLDALPDYRATNDLDFSNKRAFYYVGSTLCGLLDNTQQKITGTYLLGVYSWF